MLSTYREVVGTIIVAHEPLSVGTVSDILGTSKGDVLAVLDPIGSIINAPTLGPIHFYHATAKDFLTGPLQGDDNDQEFFFNDPKGAFLALPLLKVLNHNLRRNLANMAGSIPLGEGTIVDRKTLSKHVAYAAKHWSKHLDLSSASEELWGELHLFLTTKLLFCLEFLDTKTRPPMGFLPSMSTSLAMHPHPAMPRRTQFETGAPVRILFKW